MKIKRTNRKTPGKMSQNKLTKLFAGCFAIWVGLVSLPFILAFGRNSSQITVVGKIAVKGNEPFTFLSIANKFVEYQIVGELVPEIRKLQSQTVRLRGELQNPKQSPFSSRTSNSDQNQKINRKKNFLLLPNDLPQFRVFAILTIESDLKKT